MSFSSPSGAGRRFSQFPQSAGAGLTISLNRRALALIHFPQTPGVRAFSFPSTAGASLFTSLKRRALAPLAWLRAFGAARGRLFSHFPQTPGANSVRLAPRLRARRSRADRAAARPGPVHGRVLGGCRAGSARREAARPGPFFVMAGPRIKSGGDPAIHVLAQRSVGPVQGDARIPGSSPGISAHDDVRRDRARPGPATPDHGAVHGGGRVRQHAACKTRTDRSEPAGAPLSTACRTHCARPSIRPSRTAPPSTRSPPASGPSGEDCSRSAVGRYSKNVRELIRKQQETDRALSRRGRRTLGEPAGGRRGAHPDRDPAVHGVRHHGRPQGAGRARVDLQELDRLSRTLRRIESHREAAQGPRARGGEGEGGREGGGGEVGARRGRAPGRALAGDRRRHPRGGRGAAPACPHGHVGAGGPVESRRRSPPSRRIPANPT